MATGLESRVKRLETAQAGMVTARARRGAAQAAKLSIVPTDQVDALAWDLSQPGFWPGVVAELERITAARSGH